MSAVKEKTVYSLEEYLELEKSTDEKFEFWDGNVWSMSGARAAHNEISMNLYIDLGTRLREKGCRSFPSDMRVKVPAYPPYRYPDFTALCAEPVFEQVGGIEMLVNPQMIIEVLSESTEAFDRGDKFSYYKSIPSFTEYLLVAQHRAHVSQFVKHGDGFWANYEYNDLADSVEIKSVGISLPLSSIYRNINFETSQNLT